MFCFVPQEVAQDDEAWEDTVDILPFQNREQISLVDANGEACAHGCVLDVEPDLIIFDHQDLVHKEFQQPGLWVEVKFTSLVRGNSELKVHEDSVFDKDGDVLTADFRTPSGLTKQDRVIIYHQWIVPRLRGVGKSGKSGKRDKKSARKKARKR